MINLEQIRVGNTYRMDDKSVRVVKDVDQDKKLIVQHMPSRRLQRISLKDFARHATADVTE